MSSKEVKEGKERKGNDTGLIKDINLETNKIKVNKSSDFPEKTGTTYHEKEVRETSSSSEIDNPREQHLNI
jgi:hypothetical protein